MLRRLVLLSFAFGLLLAKVARCEDRLELPATPDDLGGTEEELRLREQLRDTQRQLDAYRHEPKEDSPYLAVQHLEYGMGFMGGLRDESQTGFVFSNGSASGVPGAQGLIGPFSTSPYDKLAVVGLAWEVRAVMDHLRMTVGVQKPFTGFSLTDAQSTTEVGGASRAVSPRAISLWDLRFGFGVEHRFRYLTPYVDLMGDAQSVTTDLTVDGASATYKAWTFGFTVRAGVRLHLGHYMYLAPMGEVGVYGPVRWAAGLQVGWVVPLPTD